MKTNNVTIEKLAEKFNASVWSKCDLKRIYLNDKGYNTKKMSTKTFIFEKDGEFIVSCRIECPSQHYQWIQSQEEKVKEGVYSRIERHIFEINNPDIDYYEYLESIRIKKENEEELAALPQKEEGWKRDYARTKEAEIKHLEYESQSDEVKQEIKSIQEQINSILGTPNSKAKRNELESQLSKYILPNFWILQDGWMKEAISFNSESEYVEFKKNQLLKKINIDK